MSPSNPSPAPQPPGVSQRHLLLFDIDGTLLVSGGAGGDAMLQTLREEFEIEKVTGDIPAAGRTDFAITSDLFEQFEIEATTAVRERFLASYLANLRGVFPTLPGRVLPGVLPLLQRVEALPHVDVALLTGNFRAAAAAKLQAYELTQYFPHHGNGEPIGGFGDDFPARDDVARVAFREANAAGPSPYDPRRTWVIGDTPADVQCGRAIGARTVAVATGLFDRPTLAACEPDVLLDTLEETAWLDQLTQGSLRGRTEAAAD